MTKKEQTIQVTTKNPKKIEAGKRLAEYNRKKREEIKAAAQKNEIQQDDARQDDVQQDQSLDKRKDPQVDKSVLTGTVSFVGGAIFVASLVGIYLVYQKKKESVTKTNVVQQPTKEKTNKFEME